MKKIFTPNTKEMPNIKILVLFYFISILVSMPMHTFCNSTYSPKREGKQVSKQNSGDSINIALIATPATSFVSSWENLNAINDGTEPENSSDKTGGAYGNWENGGNADWEWVEYSWNTLKKIYQSDIYWWTDGGGIQIPYNTYLQYWNVISESWKPLPNVEGNGILADQYNITSFDTILTSKIRVYCTSTDATGILEWKIWGSEGEQIPIGSTLALDAPLSIGTTSQVTLTAFEKDESPVADYVFKIAIGIKNELATYNEIYRVNGTDYFDFKGVISLPATDILGKTTFEITCPASIDPKDGIELRVLFNSEIQQLGDTIFLYESGQIPPVLSADVSENLVDSAIRIDFIDDAAWRASISEVSIDGVMLTEVVDYEIKTGQIILKPDGGNNALITAGQKRVVVKASGYEDASVIQNILSGEADASKSSIKSILSLYQHTSTKIRAQVFDKYGNPLQDYKLKYDIAVTNSDATTGELYTIGESEVSTSQTGLAIAATDENGIAELKIIIPDAVDLNDGISLQFKTHNGVILGSEIGYVNKGTEKEIIVQSAVKSNPDFTWANSAQSENFVVFWGKKIVGNPNDDVNGSIKFDPENILKIMESLLYYMTDSIGFIDNANQGNMAKYKHEIVMNETWTNGAFTGYAFGGSVDDKIGGMWIHPSATGGPAILAHEFTHMCQAMVLVQYTGYGLKTDYAGFFWESHANYYMAQYSNSYAGVQIERYINTAMLHFSTTRHYYQNLYFIDHVRDKYGLDTTHLIWRLASPTSSHPLTSFRDSVMRYTQGELNDDLFETARKNVTWDYENGPLIRIAVKSIQKMYIGREHTILDEVNGQPGTYVVPEHLAPGDYGYNIIPVFPNSGATEIGINFTGYDNAPAGGNGWRYGFVAVKKDGSPRYGSINKNQKASINFALESNDSLIYLVVMGAPLAHHNYGWTTGFPREYRYPYSIQITGALPAGHKAGYNSQKELIAGAPHPNGGGWIASTAKVDESVYVGSNAQVLGSASVTGSVRIEDYALVSDNAAISGSAIIRDHVIVGINSNVSGNAIVEKTARVYGTTLKDNVLITGSAMLFFSNISDEAIVKDLAYLYNSTLSGTIIVGGDAEEYTDCSEGTYLQMKTVRVSGCDGKINISMNKDINPNWEIYQYPAGSKPSTPLNLTGSETGNGEVLLRWEASKSINNIQAYYILQNGKVVQKSPSNTTLVAGLENGSYVFCVQALGIDGKVSEISNEITVSISPTSISAKKNDWVNIFPNPTDDKVTFQANCRDTVHVKILDISGKCILEREFTISLMLKKESIGDTGIYIIELSSGNRKFSDKLIVK